MSQIIEVLKAPELVVKVQNFFGIEYINSGTKECSSLSPNKTSSSHSQKNGVVKVGQVGRRVVTNASDSTSSQDEGTESSTKPAYRINNKFWYYLFLIGTELGDEIFYASFIPFWFWNIDGAVGRRVIFLWSCVMYIGQSLKDVIRWPRPGPPVIKLQSKWGLEYGMPSTHAMVAVSIPFSVLIFTQQRYLYPASVGLVIAVIWCSVICVSRIYLGMHSVLDVIAGILLTIVAMFPLVPLVDHLDFYILSNSYSPLFVIVISFLLLYYYPKSDKWTPTRGDTCMTISVCVGLQLGAWLNYQTGALEPTSLLPPYTIIWPDYRQFGLLLVRTILGLVCILATRAVSKSISYAIVCAVLGRDRNELRQSESSLENKHKTIVELCYKYFTCFMIGFSTQYVLPNMFRLLNIGRPDFYTEI